MADNSIRDLINALPDSGVTVTTLKTLDFVVPGEWVNDTNFGAMVTRLTGQGEADVVAQITRRAEELFTSDAEGFQKAYKVFSMVDTMDKVVAATAMASKIGQSFSFLSFLDKLTPKADTTQAIDAGLKLVAEVVAFLFMKGIPRENFGDFARGLVDYGKSDLMRLASWIVVDGLIPLGPDFMTKIIQNVEGISANNQLFSALSGYLPGSNADEKKGFISNALSSSSSFITNFVQEKGLTQDLVVSKMKSVVNVADSGLDYLAAALDASTNYFAHTGAQTVAREVITRAWADVQVELAQEKEAAARAAAAAHGAATRATEQATKRGAEERGSDSKPKSAFSRRADRSDDSATSPEDRSDAFIKAMCLATLADGKLQDDEADIIFEIVEGLPGVKVKRKAITKRLEESLEYIGGLDAEDAMEEIAGALNTPQERAAAYALALVVLQADGKIKGKEEDFLAAFAEALGLDEDTAAEIAEDPDAAIEEGGSWGDED